MAGPPYNIYDYIYLSHRFNCGSLSHLYCHTEDKHKLLVSDTPGFLYHPSVYDWYIQIYSPHFLYKSYTSHLLLEDKQITHPCQYYRCMTPYFARILADLARFSLNSLSIFWRSHDDSWQDALAGRVNLQECGPIFIFASKILSNLKPCNPPHTCGDTSIWRTKQLWHMQNFMCGWYFTYLIPCYFGGRICWLAVEAVCWMP